MKCRAATPTTCPLVTTGGGTDTNADGRDFTGQKENRELGLLYYNARYYVPGIGRFASADTIVPNPANPQSFNRFSYVRNNPLGFTDPSGHSECGVGQYHCEGDTPSPSFTDYLIDGLIVANDFLLGAEAQVVYNNSFDTMDQLAPSSNDTTAMRVGRVFGDAVTIVQSAAEIGGGLSLMGGGVAACGTGVLCVVSPAAVAGGAAATTHGTALMAQATGELIENGNVLFAEMTSSGSSGNESRDFTRLSKGEVNQLTRAGYHPHDLKPQKHGSRYDIFKDEYGDLYVMPKDGSGPGDPLGININDLWD